MSKTKVSSTDLIWIFHEKLQTFDDHPQHGLPIAVVPMPDGGWRALSTHHIRKRRRPWAERIEAIEKQLQKTYVLTTN